MGMIKQRKSLARELKLMKSVLAVSKTMDVSSSSTGKLLQNKGFINKAGRITVLGRKALRLL